MAAPVGTGPEGRASGVGQRSLALVPALARAVGSEHVYSDEFDLRLYDYDASIDRAVPDVVVLPGSAGEVAEVVRLCCEAGVPVTPRGAGTGLSGGSLPVEGGVVLGLNRLTRIREVDAAGLRARVEPGLVNLHLSQAVAHLGLQFVPDPSSQKASTIGGNVGENSGGPHTLLYGVTTNHVHGLEVVLPDGRTIETGGKALDLPGYDLTGLFVGSEGTLGVVTSATVRLSPVVETVRTLLAVFDSVDEASSACSGVIAAGVVPAALEMMDNLSIQAVEAAVHAGYPTDAAAVLLIEVDGLAEGVDPLVEAVRGVCSEHGAREVRLARSAKERNLLWAGRKGAFSAMGRISPDYYVMDGCVPRSSLPGVLARIDDISKASGLRVANVFHAGDGNLHPLVLFDSQKPGQDEQVREVGGEILAVCAEVGGALTGEHGIGYEKREFMGLTFSEDDLEVMARAKRALDPTGIANPGKIFPTPGRCVFPRNGGRKGAWGW
jgi:glycolate dehydrogenase FAD-linked subunit